MYKSRQQIAQEVINPVPGTLYLFRTFLVLWIGKHKSLRSFDQQIDFFSSELQIISINLKNLS